MSRSLVRWGWLGLAGLPALASAVSIAVSPIRLTLDATTRTAALTVSTAQGDKPRRVQVSLMRWTQDEAGKDVYTDSTDLIYQPRLMVVPADDQRLVRVGLRGVPEDGERAYRLLVQELPDPLPPDERNGGRVSVAVRFGIPIFVNSAKPVRAITVEKKVVQAGELHVGLRNTGTQFVRLQTVRASDASGWQAKADGWYLLAGSYRDHVIKIDPAVCAKLGTLQLQIEGEDFQLTDSFDLPAGACTPP